MSNGSEIYEEIDEVRMLSKWSMSNNILLKHIPICGFSTTTKLVPLSAEPFLKKLEAFM